MSEHTHEHLHDHAHPHDHTHPHDHSHGHVHSEEHKKNMVNRLSRAIGHLQRVKQMVEDDADCTEVLIQLSAVKSAIGNAGKEIAKEHLTHCIREAVESGDDAEIEAFKAALDKLLT